MTAALSKGKPMSKGNHQRGNKEHKKPKQEKPKVSAIADSKTGATPITVGGKKIK
ncbi:MAG: hypothetical protein SWN98_09535 [Pseudomonadota bacterium]|mgnify:CR=1 FL=1|jgi:hypothetical protein|nr:hypothetical protein [Pseudomonadota bacterium]